jgi:hypothetical protein
MLKEISNTIGSMPVSIFCLAVGAFAGRKFGLAGACKISEKIANFMGKQETSEEWSQESNAYWKLAKENAFRDLTAAAGLFAISAVSLYALNSQFPNEKPKEEIENHLAEYNFISRLKNIPTWLISVAIIWNTRTITLRCCQDLVGLKRKVVESELKLMNTVKDIQAIGGEPETSLLFQIQEKTKDLNWWKDRIRCLQNIQDSVL